MPQCKATYAHDNGSIFYCTQEQGHDGDHRDTRGHWKVLTAADEGGPEERRYRVVEPDEL